ncbi:MAG: sigma-E processing peptidase SpoIIGA [Clostridia bacterium]|nr:sigma-E processing peptidase SpoIIGA [Clostridia bacterium]
MTVYIEYILLDNLAVDMFLLYLVFIVRKRNAGLARVFAAGLTGAVFSVLYPFLGNYNYFVKVLLSPFMLAIVAKYKRFSEYAVSLAVFLIISFCLAGAVVMLSSFSAVDLTKYNAKVQLLPFFIFGSSLIIMLLLKICMKEFYKRRAIAKAEFSARVALKGGGKAEVKALYDSGNQLYNPATGEPMVIISQRLFDKLGCEKGEEIFVRTVGGLKPLDTAELDFEIYSESGQNKIYKAKAGISGDVNGEYDIILHSDMTGE